MEKGLGLAALVLSILAIFIPVISIYIWLSLALAAIAGFLGNKTLSIATTLTNLTNILFMSPMALMALTGENLGRQSALLTTTILLFIAPIVTLIIGASKGSPKYAVVGELKKNAGRNRTGVKNIPVSWLELGVVGILVSSLLGCSSPESQLTGKWVDADGKDTEHYIEFFSDNTAIMITPEFPASGKWSILSDGRIKADFEARGMKLMLLGNLQKELLVLDWEGKKKELVKLFNAASPIITQGDEKKFSEEIERQFDSKVVKCGDSWYATGGLKSYIGGGLLELKNPTLDISSDKLSNSDVANGVQFRGKVHVKVKLYREYNKSTWDAWQEANDDEAIGGLPIFSGGAAGFLQITQSPGVFQVVVQNEQYTWPQSFTNAKKPAFDCSQLPKDTIGDPILQVAESRPILPTHTSCGSNLKQWVFLQIADIFQTTQGYSFQEACQAHDACYDDCRTDKLECDKKLLANAEGVCESALFKDACIAASELFFQAVSEKAGTAFTQSRANCPTTSVDTNEPVAQEDWMLSQEGEKGWRAFNSTGDRATCLYLLGLAEKVQKENPNSMRIKYQCSIIPKGMHLNADSRLPPS